MKYLRASAYLGALCLLSTMFTQADARSVAAPTYQGAIFYHDVNGNHLVYLTQVHTTLTACQLDFTPALANLQSPWFQNTILGTWPCQQTPLPPIDFL